jgi:AcrR family transcriptional regulator
MVRTKQQRARSPQAKEELRERILQEAVALFVSEGYAGFSMRKLAQRLNYTATALYAYFENKDQLVLAIIEQGYELLASHLSAADGDAIEGLGAIGSAFMDFAFHNPKLYTLMFIHRPGTLYDLSPPTVRARMTLLEGVADAVRRAPGLSRVETVRLAELFFAVNHGLISLALTIPLFDERWARRNLRFLLDALRPLLDDATATP